MTELTSTVFRVGNVGGKRYAIGLHPGVKEPLISVREVGKRVGYVLAVSTIRIHGALAYGRAEQAAKREARKSGVPWRVARRVFQANVIPPTIKSRKKGAS